MTDHDLIRDVRDDSCPCLKCVALADALEAADARANQLEKTLQGLWDCILAAGSPQMISSEFVKGKIRAALAGVPEPPLTDADYKRAANDMPEKLAEPATEEKLGVDVAPAVVRHRRGRVGGIRRASDEFSFSPAEWSSVSAGTGQVPADTKTADFLAARADRLEKALREIADPHPTRRYEAGDYRQPLDIARAALAALDAQET